MSDPHRPIPSHGFRARRAEGSAGDGSRIPLATGRHPL